ncbi:patatin-like phospholipase family protein [Photobacterium sp. J15]|uniref:patatin-like phospholipase family protein n=1 Tax=Photobacterium sp. J15 TaxID=265901 RepID=UPI000ADA215F|nr:patatin-like phospholipase family protein [Photobacterium sp. J15]
MENKIGLAVSGGGYRATLYSLGAIWRLNQFGLLPKLKTVTSVSGGSITTAYLAIKWDQLHFNSDDVATNFDEVVALPIQRFCSRTIDVESVLSGLFSLKDTVGDKVAKAYDKHLFKEANIQDIPNHAPEFIFYGTNYQTGSSIRIQKSGITDYKIGKYPVPDLPIAKVVGISSAFPPVLSPVTLKTNPNLWEKTQYADYFENQSLRTKLQLTDGGLYDNLGLEALTKGNGDFTHVIACDAGAPFKVQTNIKTNHVSQLLRMTDLMTDQQRALRKRKLISDYKKLDGQGQHQVYGGTYFGISTKINNYDFTDSMTTDSDLTANLKNFRTRLNAFSDEEQGRLINWGYALSDTAIRKWVRELPAEKLLVRGQWPIMKYAL